MWRDTEVLSACVCVPQGWSGASVAYAVGAAVSGDGYTILQPDACEVTAPVLLSPHNAMYKYLLTNIQ